MAIIWCCIAVFLCAVFLVTIYACLVVAHKEDEALTQEAKRTVSEKYEPKTTYTVTYPVPLDQNLQDYIVETAKSYGISPCIVFAVIGAESEFQPDAKGDYIDGYYNSFGLMQIWANKHTERCLRLNAYNLLDPYQNVRVGIDYLAELMDQGDLDWALSVYSGNGGAACEYALNVQRSAECILERVKVQ